MIQTQIGAVGNSQRSKYAMREFINICEGRGGLLYHHVDMTKAEAILSTDSMPALWKHVIGGREVMGNSMSRNAELPLDRPLLLLFDQRRLAQDHRIIPVDGEVVMRQTFGYRPYVAPRAKSFWFEEFVVGDIEPLHRYVTGAALTRWHPLVGHEAIQLKNRVTDYCAAHGISLTVDPVYQTFVDNTERLWNTPEDEL